MGNDRACRRLRRGGCIGVALVLAVTLAAVSMPAPAQAAGDRHAGYYYPPPGKVEIYKARALTLPDASREIRLGFIVGMTQEMLARPYPPEYIIFAKGDDAQKMIIVGLNDGYLGSIYRARALLAMLTAVARTTQFLAELGVAEFFTFFDLAKLLGFTQITISDGDDFSHQIKIE